jgi:hypothetical protein
MRMISLFVILAVGVLSHDDDDVNKLVWPTWDVDVLSDEDEDDKPVWPTWAVGILSDDDDDKPVWPTWASSLMTIISLFGLLGLKALQRPRGRNPAFASTGRFLLRFLDFRLTLSRPYMRVVIISLVRSY